jgi:gamma-D-glutamyl-L-lysine dipeptidyl-peptidase
MAQFGFCDLAVIPLRREPSDMSEMSTQLLFGDLVEILEQSGSWLSVINSFDSYQGWVDVKQVTLINHEEYLRLLGLPLSVNRNLNSDTVIVGGQKVRLPAGCSFYGVDGQVMKVAGIDFSLEGKVYPYAFSGITELLDTGLGYLSCPYLWGGKTYMGLDCSGLTQVVFKQHGISLLRDAAQQATQGEMINFLNDSLPGDLVFFDNPEGKIVHVGILLDSQRVLHCSGKVRIDTIDHQGIFNRDLNRYTHNLRVIKRVVGL